jgi:hypothetical protein
VDAVSKEYFDLRVGAEVSGLSMDDHAPQDSRDCVEAVR